MSSAPMPTLMLVPTGIGCDIGGYAGDALPSARLLAAAAALLLPLLQPAADSFCRGLVYNISKCDNTLDMDLSLRRVASPRHIESRAACGAQGCTLQGFSRNSDGMLLLQLLLYGAENAAHEELEYAHTTLHHVADTACEKHSPGTAKMAPRWPQDAQDGPKISLQMHKRVLQMLPSYPVKPKCNGRR